MLPFSNPRVLAHSGRSHDTPAHTKTHFFFIVYQSSWSRPFTSMGRLWELYRVSFLLCQSSSSSSAILSHHSFFWDSFRRPTIRSGGLLHIDGLPKCGLSRVMLASHLPQRLLQDPDTAMTAKEGTESSHFDTPPKSNPTRIDKLPRFRHRHYLTRRARRRKGLQFAVGVCFIYHRNDFPPSFDNSLVAIFVRNKRKKRKTVRRSVRFRISLCSQLSRRGAGSGRRKRRIFRPR